jgi:flagellar protein FlaH
MQVMSTQIQPGNEISLKVTVRNDGFFFENFSVTVLNGEDKIGEQSVQNLPPQTNTDLFFNWNTTGLTSSAYNIKAIISQINNETNISNNSIEKQITLNANSTSTVATTSLLLPVTAAVLAGVVSPVGIIVYKKKKNKTTEKMQIPKTQTSNHAKFKEMIGGNFLPGSTILITGNPGSGKSVLSQFLIYQFLKEGKACLFVTYDELPSEIKKHLRSLNLDETKFEQERAFSIIDCYSPRVKTANPGKYYVEQPFSLTDLSITISTALEDIPEKTKVLVIDSITALFTKLDFPKVIRFIQDRSAKIKANGDIFIFALGKEIIDSSFTNRLEEAVDGIIELEFTEMQGKMTRRMRIKKLRGQNHLEEWVNFTIDHNKGIDFQGVR